MSGTRSSFNSLHSAGIPSQCGLNQLWMSFQPCSSNQFQGYHPPPSSHHLSSCYPSFGFPPQGSDPSSCQSSCPIFSAHATGWQPAQPRPPSTPAFPPSLPSPPLPQHHTPPSSAQPPSTPNSLALTSTPAPTSDQPAPSHSLDSTTPNTHSLDTPIDETLLRRIQDTVDTSNFWIAISYQSPLQLCGSLPIYPTLESDKKCSRSFRLFLQLTFPCPSQPLFHCLSTSFGLSILAQTPLIWFPCRNRAGPLHLVQPHIRAKHWPLQPCHLPLGINLYFTWLILRCYVLLDSMKKLEEQDRQNRATSYCPASHQSLFNLQVLTHAFLEGHLSLLQESWFWPLLQLRKVTMTYFDTPSRPCTWPFLNFIGNPTLMLFIQWLFNEHGFYFRDMGYDLTEVQARFHLHFPPSSAAAPS